MIKDGKNYKGEMLTKEQKDVVIRKGTEVPGTGIYLNNEDDGMYKCIVCGSDLFGSDSKFESTTPGLIGWPSFSELTKNNAVKLVNDSSFGMRRTEVVCSTCGAHLGHLFDDASSSTGKHYCINSCALDFKPGSKK